MKQDRLVQITKILAVWLIVTVVFPAALVADWTYPLDGYLDRDLREEVFRDNLQNSVTIFLYKDTDPISTSRIIGGLDNFDKRVDLYKNVITSLVIQSEAQSEDLLRLIAEQGLGKEEIFSQASMLFEAGSFPVELLNYVAQHANLKYVANVNHGTRLTNTWKSTLRGVRHSNLHNFNNALSAVSVVLNLVELGDQVAIISSTYILLKALEMDYADARLDALENSCSLGDPAFRQALRDVRSNLKEVPTDDWSRLLESLRQHPQEIQRMIISGGQAINGLGSLLSHTAKPSPLSGWIFAALFTWDTGVMIQEHKDHMRTASLAATIYIHLTPNKDDPATVEVTEYAQYIFIDEFLIAFDNWAIEVLSWFNKTWDEFKAGWSEKRNYVLNQISKRRIDEMLVLMKNETSDGKIVLGFILDSSGSMSSNDPDDMRKSALEIITHQIEANDDVFIVDFDDGASWLNSHAWRGWNTNELKNCIRRIDSSGGTNIGSGIQCLSNSLNQSINTTINGGVLLLTDGKGTYNNEARWFAQRNIPIYTISFVGEDNGALLRDISMLTGGKYLKARTPGDIVARFQEFYFSLHSGNRIAQFNGVIHPNQRVPFELFVDRSIEELNCGIGYEGSFVDLNMVDPNGKVYNKSSVDLWMQGDTYVYAQIKKPAAGKWRVELVGVDVEPNGEKFQFEVNAKTPRTLAVAVDTSRSSFSGGAMYFPIKSSEPITSYSNRIEKAFVVTPEADTLDISSNIQNSEVRFTPRAGVGSYEIYYEFSAEKDGEMIQRHLYESVYLGEFKPGNIGEVTLMISNRHLQANIGLINGNREGLLFRIYKDINKEPIALGYVKSVKDEECMLEIQQRLGNEDVSVGDVVELDPKFWEND